MIASYSISELIVQSEKAHTHRVDTSSCQNNFRNGFTQFSLTQCNHKSLIKQRHCETVNRRNMEDISLCEFLVTTAFSLQINKSTLLSNEALLLAHVRFVKKGNIIQ